jgi:Mor family transcriptional regulator
MTKKHGKARERGSELIVLMVDRWRERLVKFLNMPVEEADELARDMAHEVALELGGSPFYLPKDISFSLSRRDREIYAKFTGDNHSDLAKHYRLSIMRIYQIVACARAESRAKSQGKLFEIEG